MELKTGEQIKKQPNNVKRSEINGPEERDRPPSRRNSSTRKLPGVWMLLAKKIALLLKGYGLMGADRVTRCPVEGGRRVARVEALSLLT